MEDSEPRVASHYDDVAGVWDWIVDQPTRRRLLWPAIDDLLPDVAGLRVLDAGCGSGVYDAELADRGADVIGVDVSEAMVREARERVPDATFRQGDLTDGLAFLDDGSVDVVLCQHVFSHLPDVAEPLAEFARVLADGGSLVVSTHHPLHDYLVVRDGEYLGAESEAEQDAEVETGGDGPRYAATERYDVVWKSAEHANRGTYYRRPLAALFDPALDAGLTLRDVVEPEPDAAFASEHPDLAAELRAQPPSSLCVRWER